MTVPRSVELKLNRATEHINALDEAQREFLDQEPYAFRRELKSNGTEHVFYWERFTSPPDSFSIISGDAIHNLRSSLDHLAVALAEAGARKQSKQLTQKEIGHIQFPVVTSDSQFNKQVSDKRLLYVEADARNEICKLQPYNRSPGNPELSPLFRVSSLDNTDKHRQLIVTPLAPSVHCVNWPRQLQDVALTMPNPPVPRTTNAEIGRFVFPSPHSEVDIKVEFGWGFTMMVDGNGPAWDIIYILNNYKDFVVKEVINPLADKYLT